MLAELARSAIEFLKLAPRYFLSVAVVASLLLFLPQGWLLRIGVASFAESNRQWLGIALLGSGALWTVGMAADLLVWLRRVREARRFRHRAIRKLQSLTEDEKQILRYYFSQGTRANMLRIDDGVVRGLVADGIIYQSASVGNLREGFAHNITDFAWDYIRENPKVLLGATDTYRTDKWQRLW